MSSGSAVLLTCSILVRWTNQPFLKYSGARRRGPAARLPRFSFDELPAHGELVLLHGMPPGGRGPAHGIGRLFRSLKYLSGRPIDEI
jgi:hypothetical protein